MYDLPDQGSTDLYQGDIFDNYPFLNLGATRPVRLEGEEVRYLEGDIDSNTELVLTEVNPQRVMVITQTCDAQRRENIIICPIYELEKYISSNNPTADQLSSLRKGKIYYWFYLPEQETKLPESFVDLQQFIYIPREKFMAQAINKILTLNSLGRHRLSWCISNYFGRPL